MPAGAFAASGPTSHWRSKARSRTSRAATGARTSRPALRLMREVKLRAGPSPRNRTVSKKYFGDNVVGLTRR